MQTFSELFSIQYLILFGRSMNIKERIYAFIKYKGISIKRFEEICHLSNGYISSMRKGFGTDKLNNVLTLFPELNREWLLYGEGEMINPIVNQTNTSGDNIQGHSVTINKTEGDYLEIIKSLTSQLSVSQQQISVSQEQINRLITIIENKS